MHVKIKPVNTKSMTTIIFINFKCFLLWDFIKITKKS